MTYYLLLPPFTRKYLWIRRLFIPKEIPKLVEF